jgi:hypothetical protein
LPITLFSGEHEFHTLLEESAHLRGNAAADCVRQI